MKVIIEGQLLSIYKGTDFKDKETGTVSEGKHKLQLLIKNELENGSVRNDMQEISVPDHRVEEFESLIGEHVQVKCEVYSKNHVSFYVK